MTTLAAAVAVGDQQLLIDAPMAGPFPGWVKIDSELLEVGGQEYRNGTVLPLSSPANVAHDSGATVTYAGKPYNPAWLAATAGGGGGSISATDGTTTVDPATSIRAAVISAGGAGEAVIGSVIVSETDPGAVGPGILWLRPDVSEGITSLFVRNDTDDGWITPSFSVYGEDGTNPTPTSKTLNSDGSFDTFSLDVAGLVVSYAYVREDKAEIGFGNGAGGGQWFLANANSARIQAENEFGEGGLLTVAPAASTLSAGDGAGLVGTVSGEYNRARMQWVDGISIDNVFDIDATGLHYTGVRPEIPATPTEQDIVDALVALGLVTQAAP
jgi:hypothetical protein